MILNFGFMAFLGARSLFNEPEKKSIWKIEKEQIESCLLYYVLNGDDTLITFASIGRFSFH